MPVLLLKPVLFYLLSDKNSESCTSIIICHIDTLMKFDTLMKSKERNLPFNTGNLLEIAIMSLNMYPVSYRVLRTQIPFAD